MERVELVQLHVPAELDLPIEPLLENAVAQTMHSDEFVDELATLVG